MHSIIDNVIELLTWWNQVDTFQTYTQALNTVAKSQQHNFKSTYHKLSSTGACKLFICMDMMILEVLLIAPI